ncbi:VanZ family protein [Reichenbachiella sp.]|uniref:VanZ family protein n=1 Tax=Reichenbachiella sp. TaxID=2184521 RepID=UPI0032671098
MLFATLSPSDEISQFEIPIPHFDKIVHFGLFCVHSFLVSASVASKRWILIPLMLGLALAGSTEMLQSYVPGRQSDWLDLLADVAGTAIGLLSIYFIKKNE